MADKKTLRLLSTGAVVADGDLFISRQGADVEDVSVTAQQILDYLDDSGTFVARAGDNMLGALTLADLANALNSGDYPLQLLSGVADGATAEGVVLGTANALSTNGAKPLRIHNGGVDILSQEYISGIPYMKIPGRMILGEATGNINRLIDAKITLDPPAFQKSPALQFEAIVNTANVLTVPTAIAGIARLEAAGFGGLPVVFDAETINDQDVNNPFNAIGFYSNSTNNSDLVASLMSTGFLNAGARQGKIPNSHNIAYGSAAHAISPSVGQEAVAGGFNVALYAAAQNLADNCYSVVATGNTENNAYGFGGSGNLSIGTPPTDTIQAKMYYDNVSLMLLSDFSSDGKVGAVGGLAVGNNTALGAEEVTSWSFTASTGWTLGTGWTITGGQLVSTGQTNATATQTLTLTEGRMYKVEYVIQGNDFSINNGNCPELRISGCEFPRKFRAGTYVHYFVASASQLLELKSKSNVESVQYDSISIKECQGGDLYVAGVSKTNGRIKNTTRITIAESPYTVLVTDHVIKADTDGGAITINLPAGIDGTNLEISNVGSSANDVTLTPNGTELLYGVNASETMFDGEKFEITYETTEGWD